VSFQDAGKMFGISRERVRQKWRALYGDEVPPTIVASRERAEAIARLAREGLTATEISEQIGVSAWTVRHHLDANATAIATHNDKTGTTEETKAKIVELARAEKSTAEIAQTLGVNYYVVRKVLRHRRVSTHGDRGNHDGRCAAASDFMDRTGCSLSQAAAHGVISPPSLWQFRKRRGLWTTAAERDARGPSG